ncbi:MAG: hypothetical protein ACI3XM_00180 [Eubacteriales bacterium]
MKKIFSAIAAAAVLASCAAVSVSAVGAEDWTAGNGYLIEDINATVLVENTMDGVKVTHGGYYIDGVNWGGVAYNTPVKLDGFSVEIRIDEIPDFETGDDAWFAVCFLSKPELFRVGAYDSNPGISNLLRFTHETPTFQEFGPDSFSCVNQTPDDALAMSKGSTVTVSVAETSEDTYVLTVNGVEMPTEYDLADIAPNGEAYLVISASYINSNPDAFKYTILSVNGEPTYVEEVPVEEPDTSAEPVDSQDTTAPTTADAGIVAAAALMAAAAGVVLSKKRV